MIGSGFPGRGRIWLATEPADMRLSYDGLSALVRNRLGRNPISGDWYVFLNRRRTMLKVIAFDRGGYWIWSKRLESGLFTRLTSSNPAEPVSATGLMALVDGIDIIKSRQRKRYARAA